MCSQYYGMPLISAHFLGALLYDDILAAAVVNGLLFHWL